MDKEEKRINKLGITIPLKRIFPEDLKSYFVTNMTVQHQSDHFIIQFFEAFPPLILGTEEEKKSIIESLDHVEAKCVSRIIVTPDKFRDFIETLSENYNNYQKKYENKEEDNDIS
jgi:hypothetical protein